MRLFPVLVLAAVLLSGCMCAPEQKPEQFCDPPYIQVGKTCCLDANSNSVCDQDETTTSTAPPQTTVAPIPTTLLQTTTTNLITTSSILYTTTSILQTTTYEPSTTIMLTTTLPPTCTDSDGGNMPYVKGDVVRGFESGSDKCLSTASLLEYFCIGNRISTETILCSAGCEAGVCLGCTDSDGGDEPDIYGTVTIGKTLTRNDYCSNQGDGNKLREYLCFNVTDLTYADHICGTCSNGRCV